MLYTQYSVSNPPPLEPPLTDIPGKEFQFIPRVTLSPTQTHQPISNLTSTTKRHATPCQIPATQKKTPPPFTPPLLPPLSKYVTPNLVLRFTLPQPQFPIDRVCKGNLPISTQCNLNWPDGDCGLRDGCKPHSSLPKHSPQPPFLLVCAV